MTNQFDKKIRINRLGKNTVVFLLDKKLYINKLETLFFENKKLSKPINTENQEIV